MVCPRCCDHCTFEMEVSPWFPKEHTFDIFTEVSSSSPCLQVLHGVRLWQQLKATVRAIICSSDTKYSRLTTMLNWSGG